MTGSDPDPEGDGILAGYLVVDWFQGEGEHFHQSLTRQFQYDAEPVGIKVWYSDV